MLLSLSLSSTASNMPVDAPLGTAALPTVPSSRITSASIVGFDLESSICLALTSTMSTLFFICNASYFFIRLFPVISAGTSRFNT